MSDISNIKNTSVLYVEDEKSLREVTSEILKSFMKNLYVATNGQEGYELFLEKEENIDIIITDINMPVLSGLEMIKKIKEVNSKVPIVVTTAFSNKEYLLDAINIGVDKYVLKPLDITQLLQAVSQSLSYFKMGDLYKDTLTNLANKNRLQKDLAHPQYKIMALLDIDELIAINDLFGEKIGDKILQEFANKMIAFFNKDKYSLYRIESDKFAVIPKQPLQINDFYKICKKFLEKTEDEPFIVDDNEIDVNMTIGIAQEEGLRLYKYVKRVIMYARKRMQKIMIYDDSYNIHKSYEENLKWLKLLKHGFKDNRLKAYFQPIVDTKTKETIKYEALIRYIAEDGTEHGPFDFLSVAKKTKLYPNIIKVILDDSLKLIKNKNKKVSINISYDDILNDKTTSYIYNFLKKNQEICPFLEFELLETEEITNFNIVQKFIMNIKAFSCRVGIDDFGSGYSNFNLLSKFHVDFIKIDGSLIENIHKSRDLRTIVKTIINIARKFNIQTIAEFVANEDIYDTVKALDIDLSQGYFFEKPIPYENIE